MCEVHRVGCLEYLNWRKSGGSIGLPSLSLVCSGKGCPRVGVSGVGRWRGGGRFAAALGCSVQELK